MFYCLMIKVTTTINPMTSNIKNPQIATPGMNPKNNPKNPAKLPPTKNNAIHVVRITAMNVLIQKEPLSKFYLFSVA